MIDIDGLYFELSAPSLRKLMERGLCVVSSRCDDAPAAVEIFPGQGKPEAARSPYYKQSFVRARHWDTSISNIAVLSLCEHRFSRRPPPILRFGSSVLPRRAFSSHQLGASCKWGRWQCAAGACLRTILQFRLSERRRAPGASAGRA